MANHYRWQTTVKSNVTSAGSNTAVQLIKLSPVMLTCNPGTQLWISFPATAPGKAREDEVLGFLHTHGKNFKSYRLLISVWLGSDHCSICEQTSDWRISLCFSPSSSLCNSVFQINKYSKNTKIGKGKNLLSYYQGILTDSLRVFLRLPAVAYTCNAVRHRTSRMLTCSCY